MVDNDEVLCELSDPPLSSIQLNNETIGYEAAALLERMLRGAKTAGEEFRFSPRCVVARRSGETLAISDPDVADTLRPMAFFVKRERVWGRKGGGWSCAGLTTLCCGSLSILLVDAAHPWWLLAPAILLGTGHALTFHTMASLSLDSFPAPVRGTGSVLALMHIDLGLIAGGPLLGQIAYRFGYSWLFIVTALCALGASVLYAWSSVPVWKSRRLARLASADAARTRRATLATPGNRERKSGIMESSYSTDDVP